MKFSWFICLAILFISGCGHTPVRHVYPAALPPETAEPAVSAARAEAFKKVLAPAAVRGVVLYPSAFGERFDDRTILQTVSRLGFNRIYCHLTSEQQLDDRLTGFLTAAGKYDIPVEIVFSQADFYRRYRGNRLIRNCLIQYPDITGAVEELIEYQQELPENVKISGVTVILTPHLFNGDNVERIQGKIYSWSDDRYGIGRDNDMLMQESLTLAGKIAALPGIMPLTIAIADFYHDRAAAGELSCGKVTDFFAPAKKVAVISSGNLPSKLPGNVSDELAAAPAGKKILIFVPLAEHTSVDNGKLRRRNWNDFQRSINNLIRKSAASPAFGGVIISPLSVVEFLRQEK
ncbi:MAG: hypothetical protein E7043_01880 [Lentisphaerae bacterium]|nr:hypothetical protein [Lentisphaerota bacterium]